MKKINFLLIALIACVASVTACRPDDDPSDKDSKYGVSTIVEAASDFYTTWEEERAIPATIKVGTKELTTAEFTYAEAAALVNIAAGKTDDIAVKSYKAASNPDRDSYDQSEIAVKNGAADGKGVAEDIVTIANRLLEAAKEKEQIPNQVLVYRGSDALAFSANRAVITIARTLSEYATNGKLSDKVSTEYLSATTTLKAFAEQFVGYLDVWENTVADILSADGSHCEDNGTAWEKVHFIPIPQDQKNDWANQGGQYDPKYLPYKTIEIEGTTYTAAQCWEIAIRGLMNMCTTEGEAFLETMARNSDIPYGNGKSLSSAPISRPSDACIWGKYPWYESTNDGGPVKYKGEDIKEVGLEFIMKCGSWHVTRSFIANANNSPLGMIGNFQQFGTTASTLNLDGYEGLIAPMREFLILARFYKYILDNNINKNVYDALKDVKVDFELYKQELPIVVKAKDLTFEAEDTNAQTIDFTATAPWNITVSDSWIVVTPASGAAGEAKATVKVEKNTVTESRKGTINFKVGDYVKQVNVTQNAYVPSTKGTLKEFAQAFVTCLDTWQSTVGTVDADGMHNGATAWQNVHFIPMSCETPGFTNPGNQYDAKWTPWVAKVGDTEYTSSQCWEIAIRGLMNLCTKEGEEFLAGMDDRNKAYTLANGVGMDSPIPTYSSSNKWNGNSWYEFDKTVTYNGEAIKTVGLDFILKCGSWHVVRSFIKVGSNNPLNAIGNFQEFGTSASTLNLTGYEGLICPQRELLILARIYKYILDNNITTNVYDAIKDVKFDFDLYGNNIVTIKAWAQEFVKCLDVWQSTVGTVDSEGTHNGATAWQNVHFVPILNPNNVYNNPGNQYDAKWTPFVVKVGDTEFTSSQCWEIAIRGLMDLCTKEGDEFLTGMDDRNKAYTLANGVAMTAVVPTCVENNVWGKYPWYETDDALVTYNGEAIKTVDVNFLIKCGSWHIVRGFIKTAGNASPLGMIGNYQEFGTTASTLNLEGYKGIISPMREMLIAARIYKAILDKKVDTNVYDAIKDVKVAFDLY